MGLAGCAGVIVREEKKERSVMTYASYTCRVDRGIRRSTVAKGGGNEQAGFPDNGLVVVRPFTRLLVVTLRK